MNHPHLVLARLYEHIEPIDRGERYEDPLHAVLEREKAGEVAGGGTQLSESGVIEYVDLELNLANLDRAVDLVVAALESAGAPERSAIVQGDKVLRTFGTHQCLAIYLDGTSLPDDVYANLDFDRVVADLGALAGPQSYHGFSQGNEETGLFFFDPDAEALFTRLEPLLRTLPIAQNARVVVRHGPKSASPRTIRLPRL